jgi:predicted HAD superfamily Cof-like phosphohydrolase
MKNKLTKVNDFHVKFGQGRAPVEPTLLTKEEFWLRYKLMKEENDEYLEAALKFDKVGIADALGDQLYILCGTILKHGMQNVIENVFDEIHASNMSKADENGKPIFREDGKILKGKNYFKPDLSKFL